MVIVYSYIFCSEKLTLSFFFFLHSFQLVLIFGVDWGSMLIYDANRQGRTVFLEDNYKWQQIVKKTVFLKNEIESNRTSDEFNFRFGKKFHVWNRFWFIIRLGYVIGHYMKHKPI